MIKEKRMENNNFYDSEVNSHKETLLQLSFRCSILKLTFCITFFFLVLLNQVLNWPEPLPVHDKSHTFYRERPMDEAMYTFPPVRSASSSKMRVCFHFNTISATNVIISSSTMKNITHRENQMTQ